MEELGSEERQRLWEHALHEDLLFNERLGSFVALQSILLAMAAALVLADAASAATFVRAVGAVGVVTSLLSAYFQKRQADYVELLATRCEQHLPEFKKTHQLRQATALRRVVSQRLYALLLPGLFILVWTVLLAT